MSDEVCIFVWYELTTPDLDAAQDFYRQVVGWNIVDAKPPKAYFSRCLALSRQLT